MKQNKYYDKTEAYAIRRSAIPAALMQIKGLARFDSKDAASVFFARELDYIKSQAYETEYPDLMAFQLFPIDTEADPGAESITYYVYDKEGQAKVIDNYSTDLPRADANGRPSTAYVKSIGVSYGYSAQEMRASRMADKHLDARKADSAHYQIDAAINRIAWAGDADHNLLGVLSAGQNIPTYTITAGNTTNTTSWLTKDADEILLDVMNMYSQVSKSTKGIERPDTLVLPTDIHIALGMKRVGDTADTVLTFIQRNAPFLKKIEAAAELNSDSVETNPYASLTANQGQGVALLYTNDSKKLALHNPMAFLQYPVQVHNLETIVPCEARTAGVIVPYPMSALIAIGV